MGNDLVSQFQPQPSKKGIRSHSCIAYFLRHACFACCATFLPADRITGPKSRINIKIMAAIAKYLIPMLL